jgi:hypothetical protein
MSGIRTDNFVVIGKDCIGSCKSNYHTITTTTAPVVIGKRYPGKVVEKNHGNEAARKLQIKEGVHVFHMREHETN